MIRGNLLSYSSADLPWYARNIENTLLNSILTSVLVTLISYQTAALVFDLVLGVKKRKSTKIKTLGVLMLTWKSSSPLAVCNSVLRADWITRRYYKGDLPKGTKIARDPARVKLVTVLMLFVLLLAAPVLDTAFIILSLSRTTQMSFSEAGFGGIKHGLRENLQILDTVPFMTSCKLVKFDSRRNDFIDAKFSLCLGPILPQPAAGNPTGFAVAFSNTSIQVSAMVRGQEAVSTNFAELQTKDGSFGVKAGLTQTAVTPLTKMALELLRKECGEIAEIGSLPETIEGKYVASVAVRCARNSTTVGPEMIIAEALREKFTLTPSRELRVISPDLSKEVNAKDFHLLQSRERNASTFALVLGTVLLLLVRGILGFVLSNDVADCLEYIIKDRLGFNRCDSLFWTGKERISFRKKFQEGEVAELGLDRNHLREVEKFTDGTVGGQEHSYDKT